MFINNQKSLQPSGSPGIVAAHVRTSTQMSTCALVEWAKDAKPIGSLNDARYTP